MAQAPTIFGIRHHGPGSARSLRRALEAQQPDIVLVEGPPDAAEVLALAGDPGMRPPVALLIYAPADPRQAVYYPFTHFSPEWQAIMYALEQTIPVRFMDLPQRYRLETPEEHEIPQEEIATDAPPAMPGPRADPLGWLAAAAGYSDGERWWDHMIEQRRDDTGVFAAILEMMTILRAEAEQSEELPQTERLREAWMRRTIRQAQSEGFQRIAVVCGAWHGPALTNLSAPATDEKLLKGLRGVDVRATWVPWTHSRLSYQSGYGAGIESPGWYQHLWQSSAGALPVIEVAIRWMAKIARLLRAEGLDASSANVIEAVRLAETLAALRERPVPGLPELNESAQAVFCFANDLPMKLIHDKLIVGEILGDVPDSTPLAPLQQDLAQAQRRLRMPAEASWREYDLDLRKPNDLERSRLLHRLALLGVPWGKLQRTGGGKGTFHEIWRLEWQPELAVRLIEAGVWGNTIRDAATARVRHAANTAIDLPELTRLVDQALLADLPEAVEHLMQRVQYEAAIASDIAHLMAALPPLAHVLRYGNVRKTDATSVAGVVEGLVTRIAIGLPGACVSLNDSAAEQLFPLLEAVNSAIVMLQDEQRRELWLAALRRVSELQGCHGLLGGRAVRILLDAGVIDAAECARRMGLALSTATEPAHAAAWVEGLIKDSGALLVHDDTLWQVINSWVISLNQSAFTQTLPLLRRTFAGFGVPERRALGERAKHGASRARTIDTANFDTARAETALGVVVALLGLEH